MGLSEQFARERGFKKVAAGEAPVVPGSQVERALLGEVLPRARNNDAYVPFKKAFVIALQNQPERTKESTFARELCSRIQQLCSDQETPVRLFTTVGSALDVYHGVDAIVAQGMRYVTVDVSMREKEYYKADVLICARMGDDGEVSVDEEELQHAAEACARKLTEH